MQSTKLLASRLLQVLHTESDPAARCLQLLAGQRRPTPSAGALTHINLLARWRALHQNVTIGSASVLWRPSESEGYPPMIWPYGVTRSRWVSQRQRTTPPTARLSSKAQPGPLGDGATGISKLLIANRGEIACRVVQTARRLGESHSFPSVHQLRVAHHLWADETSAPNIHTRCSQGYS